MELAGGIISTGIFLFFISVGVILIVLALLFPTVSGLSAIYLIIKKNFLGEKEEGADSDYSIEQGKEVK